MLGLLPAPAASTILSLVFPDSFRFLGRLHGVGVAAGIELAAAGLVFLAAAALGLQMARGRKRLATTGAFGMCRHPAYAWWVWSVTPSLALILDSWLLVPAVLASYIVARRLAKKEDDDLWEKFGRQFAAYEVKVRLLFPLPRIRPLRIRRLRKAVAFCALLLLFVLGAYFAAVRPVILRLGATSVEAGASMEGDQYIARPRVVYTQAAVIHAPAEEVWKWLVQVGYKRAGWYNIDAINRLVGPEYFLDGRGSSNRIHPELQDLAVGDTIFLVPVLGMTVTHLTPARLLVMAGDPDHPDADSNACWTYALHPRGTDSCRLVVRFRSASPPGFLWAFASLVFNEIGGAVLQQPAMLAGIKFRAERDSPAGKRP